MASVMIFSQAALIREAIAALLRSAPDIDVLGTYGNYRELLDDLDKQLPDILVVDLYDLEIGGTLIAEALLAHYPGVKLLMLSESSDVATALAMYRMGVYSYIHKSHSGHLLKDAIYNIDRQRIFLYAEASPRIYTQSIQTQSANEYSFMLHSS